MPTLYHTPPAICAQKVRVCLAEKGVSWKSENIDGNYRCPEYLALNPAGYVPTLVHDGRVITESRIISEYIDEAFDGPLLQPADPFERSVMRRWTKQIDDTLHPFIFVLSFVAIFRERIIGLSEEEQQRLLPLDPVRAERMLNLLKLGWESRYPIMALQRFEKLTIDLDSALTNSNWLAGESYSLADTDFTPYLNRMRDLGLEWLWQTRPALSDWFDRVQERPSFSSVAEDWISLEERQATAANSALIGERFRQILTRA